MPRVLTLSGLGSAQPAFHAEWGPRGFVTPGPCQNPVLPTNKGCTGPIDCALQGVRLGGLRLGDAEEATSPAWYMHPVTRVALTAAVAASAYHGYKRTRSLGWTLVWAAAGLFIPIVTIPVALAQGFGKRR